ncbi:MULTISPECIES: hypothetical protein [unclassified Arthrobacter]|uniref:hypothetical protein n=1 Tax=unclassified Arthrobacter TaxID=235627 RepID=UPI00159EA1CC|nr:MULTISPECIES: hypothetical protein [unclassified Arthrobacter]MCQ9164251.1 hypothetical protein [Arthrobacter sp. STN4]NVN00456.1 hypothetical protein [Arthrobacter sp. SDTb3-6]
MSGRLNVEVRRSSRRTTAPARPGWLRWLALSMAAGIVAGIVWWLAAPGGAFYGQGKDYTVWPGRDLVLAGVCVLCGLLAGMLLARHAARYGTGAAARFLAVLAGGLLGSVLAWRVGVFAGDLFQTPPDNMPSPSMVFSLRSPSVLLLWPLAASAVVFVYAFLAYTFVPQPRTTR